MFDFFINNIVIWLTQTEHLNLLMIKMRAFVIVGLSLISTFLINAQVQKFKCMKNYYSSEIHKFDSNI